MALDVEDIQMILDEVARFATQRILPESARYERPMSADLVRTLLGELTELGVLPSVPDDESPGLWADTADAGSVKLSLGILRQIGRANAALALAAHRQALAHWLLTQIDAPAGQSEVSQIALVTCGHYGLARSSLGRWLAHHAPITNDDVVLLADWLDFRHHDACVWSAPHWRQLMAPVLHEGLVQWALFTRDQLSVTLHAAPHGLEELETCTARSSEQTSWVSKLDGEAARHVYASLLKLEYIGLQAIGLGIVSRGAELAHDFAAMRRQGGAVINRHAAVQTMLSDISSTECLLATQLSGLVRPLDAVALEDIASARYGTSEALVHACHQVMQVYGGIGYMRDAGPEKFVRDQNMLRLASGGAQALPLFISGLKEHQP